MKQKQGVGNYKEMKKGGEGTAEQVICLPT